MKPFDLEKALAGEMIYSPSYDEKAWLIGESKFDNVSYILEYENGRVEAEKIDAIRQHFVMYEEPSPRPTVTLTLPCPLKEPKNKMWFLTDGDVCFSLYNEKMDSGLFNSRILFASREDAEAWLGAMRNNRR